MGQTIRFDAPRGAPSFGPPTSMTWRVFKNQATLAIGGIAAVMLELAEPRVRHGVWDHSSFREKPFARMRRTGRAAMITVYAPRETAETVIAGVRRMHDRVSGVTPCGKPYHANDPELLAWVQATASFGFVEAYRRFAAPLPPEEVDRFYADTQASARAFGAVDAPASAAEQAALFAAMQPLLEPSDILQDFIAIVRRALPMPGVAAETLVRAAASILPPGVRGQIGLGELTLSETAARRLQRLARLADRTPIPGSPPVRACRRMGLPGDWLYRTSPQTLDPELAKS